jgi:DHA1 family inner membrane transport protein
VGVGAAGQAVTVYALSIAVLAPLALLGTRRWPRKRVLLAAIGLFAVGTAVCAAAPNLASLLAGRALMGIGAVFTPVAAAITLTLVEPGRRGQALALVFLGMSLSYVIGVPLGAWLGLNLGWRAPIWLASACSALATLAVAALVPRDIQAPGATFAGLGALLRRTGVASALGMTLLYFGAIFSVFSYIGPVLQALSPMSGGMISLTLMLFGLSGVAGTLIGGWANDRFGAVRTLRFLLGQFLLSLLLLPLTRGHYGPMLLCFLFWGVAGFGMMAPQQARLVAIDLARSPLLLSLNSSMMYFGMALGAVVGGAAVPAAGFDKLAWVGAPLALAALGLLWRSTRSAPVRAAVRGG